MKLAPDEFTGKRYGKYEVLCRLAVGGMAEIFLGFARSGPFVNRPVVLKNIPPRFSWDVALMPSFGMQPQFVDTPPWLGLGFRAAWGRHFKAHRVGAAFGFSVEGALSVQWSNNFEPQAVWDYVGKKHLWLGASLGLDLQLNVDIPPGSSRGVRYGFIPAPLAAVRLGYSQYWSLISRRFFVGIEPRLRIIGDQPAFGVAIAIGSGVGY